VSDSDPSAGVKVFDEAVLLEGGTGGRYGRALPRFICTGCETGTKRPLEPVRMAVFLLVTH
jgi:hypothetical protein